MSSVSRERQTNAERFQKAAERILAGRESADFLMSDARLLAHAVTSLLADSARLAELEAERNKLEETLLMHGYRRCDIAACHCGGWHGGSAAARLTEIIDELKEAGCQPMQKTALVAVQELVAANKRLREYLNHMKYCSSCAEGDWNDCETGREALAALAQKH